MPAYKRILLKLSGEALMGDDAYGINRATIVRMVQQVRVPPLRQFNPRVTPELEQVLAHALAGDPAKRYQSARDLGRDLNKILFHIGREVSSFDIAQLVTPIWRDRVEKKRRVDRGSIIGSLIDEALFEFTSLEGEAERKSQVSMVGAMPLSLKSFENVQNWSADLGLSDNSETPIADSLEVGNLASLEDDPISHHAPPQRIVQQPTPVARVTVPQAPEQLSSVAPLAETPPRPAPKTGMVAGAIAIAALLAAAAGAYFSGFIGH